MRQRRRSPRRFTCPRCGRPEIPFFGSGQPYLHTCIGVAPLNLDHHPIDTWWPWLNFRSLR